MTQQNSEAPITYNERDYVRTHDVPLETQRNAYFPLAWLYDDSTPDIRPYYTIDAKTQEEAAFVTGIRPPHIDLNLTVNGEPLA